MVPVPHPAETAAATPNQSSLEWLSSELRQRVAVAAAAGLPDPVAICEHWVLGMVRLVEVGLEPGKRTCPTSELHHFKGRQPINAMTWR